MSCKSPFVLIYGAIALCLILSAVFPTFAPPLFSNPLKGRALEQFGRCCCGALTYDVPQNPLMEGQCHWRECQFISGGGPQDFLAMPVTGFTFTAGTPQSYQRADLNDPVTREFCSHCGTHILIRRLDFDGVPLKVGTLHDPAQFEKAHVAIYTKDIQPFHHIPEGCPETEGAPPQ